MSTQLWRGWAWDATWQDAGLSSITLTCPHGRQLVRPHEPATSTCRELDAMMIDLQRDCDPCRAKGGEQEGPA